MLLLRSPDSIKLQNGAVNVPAGEVDIYGSHLGVAGPAEIGLQLLLGEMLGKVGGPAVPEKVGMDILGYSRPFGGLPEHGCYGSLDYGASIVVKAYPEPGIRVMPLWVGIQPGGE